MITNERLRRAGWSLGGIALGILIAALLFPTTPHKLAPAGVQWLGTLQVGRSNTFVVTHLEWGLHIELGLASNGVVVWRSATNAP